MAVTNLFLYAVLPDQEQVVDLRFAPSEAQQRRGFLVLVVDGERLVVDRDLQGRGDVGGHVALLPCSVSRLLPGWEQITYTCRVNPTIS